MFRPILIHRCSSAEDEAASDGPGRRRSATELVITLRLQLTRTQHDYIPISP